MSPLPQISNREREVIRLLLEGKSNKLIAQDMKVAERTIEFHLTNIYSKFQVSSRTELILRLKDDPRWLESENPGESTVANEENLPDNSDRPDSSNWVTSLKAAVAGIGKELSMAVSSVTSTGANADPTDFFGSIRICMAKYADFQGRASRPEFWWFALFVLLGTSAFTLISETLGSLFLLAVLLPLLAAGARRLRDSGNSPWWLAILLAPVGGIIVAGFLWAQPPVDSVPEEEAMPS